MGDWKNGHDAVAILSFDVDAESPILAHGREYADHAMVMTHQAFGPRVGVPRILQLLADYDLPATFFIPGLTADRYPAMVESVLAAGHEVAHHSYSHHSAVDLDADGERRDFERALEADPDYGLAASHLGQVHQLLLNYREAAKALRRAVAIDASNVEARTALAAVFSEQGDADEAIRQLTEVLRLETSNDEVYAMLARAYWDKSAWAQAVSYADKALALNGSNAQAHLW